MPIIRDIVYGAAARGAHLNEICRRLKIDVADLGDSEKRVDFGTACLSWELAVKMTGDRRLGQHIGESTNPSIMGLVGLLMQNSRTLLDAFRYVSKYGHVATNMFRYEIIERREEVILQYTPVAIWQKLYPTGARQAVDQAKSGTLNVFYLLSGKKIEPVTSKRNQLIFRREQLQTPVLHYDRSLFKVFEDLVRKKGQKRTFSGQVKDLIINEFRGQTPSIEVVASKFNITVRSFQRRLSVENTSFRRISGQITKEVARRLMRSTGYKRSEIAKILGYSSPRALRRALSSG